MRKWWHCVTFINLLTHLKHILISFSLSFFDFWVCFFFSFSFLCISFSSFLLVLLSLYFLLSSTSYLAFSILFRRFSSSLLLYRPSCVYCLPAVTKRLITTLQKGKKEQALRHMQVREANSRWVLRLGVKRLKFDSKAFKFVPCITLSVSSLFLEGLI